MPKTKALHSDFGTPERAAHGPVVIERVPDDMADTKNRDRAFAEPVDCPLYYYKRNKTISPLQYDAGIRLRGLWHSTGLEPRIVGQYSDMVARGSVEGFIVDTADRQRAYADAMCAVGAIASKEIVAACCVQEKVQSSCVEILRRGLDQLIRHFGWG